MFIHSFGWLFVCLVGCTLNKFCRVVCSDILVVMIKLDCILMMGNFRTFNSTGPVRKIIVAILPEAREARGYVQPVLEMTEKGNKTGQYGLSRILPLKVSLS